MKIRVKTEDRLELSTIYQQLKLKAADGKMRATDCAQTQRTMLLMDELLKLKI